MTSAAPLNSEISHPHSGAGVLAFAVGAFSGPAAVVLAMVEVFKLNLPLGLGFLTLLFCLVAPLVFCIVVLVRLRHPDSPHGRSLAAAGILATVGWAIAIMFFLGTVLGGMR